ncbi:MAG TPA: histidine phosphatase family protein [Allosphingosinicella sp.]|jgi:phosphohistidine phosphatase SixA
MTKRCAALLALALSACVASREPAPEPAFYVMRHLHKEAGADPALSPQGWRCARRLAEELADAGIRAVYATVTQRALETGLYVAERADTVPLPYDARDIAGLVTRVRATAGSILIVGHSNTVPDIVEALGGTRPGDLGDDSYGEVWRVARPSGATTVRRIDC